MLLLVTRDGNNQLVLLALCICLVENAANYSYFAVQCLASGLGDYLNRKEQLLYSDRHKGIPSFEEQFECGTANCIQHIIENVRQHLRRTGAGADALRYSDKQVLRIQQAPTQLQYKKQLATLRRTSAKAAEYIDKLDHSKTFTYSLLDQGFANHGHCTSNIVEIMNSALKCIRELAPYHMLNGIVTWLASKLAASQEIVSKLRAEKELYTPYAADHIALMEYAAREEPMEITDCGNDVFRVKHRANVDGWISYCFSRFLFF